MSSIVRSLIVISASVAVLAFLLSRGTRPWSRSISRGVLLVANVTDPAHDLQPSVQGMVLQGYHVGAASDVAVLHTLGKGNEGRVFYLNGSSPTDTSLISDVGSFPFGMIVPAPRNNFGRGSHQNRVHINVGGGTPARVIESDAGIIIENRLGQGTFLACQRMSDYYRKELIMLAFSYRDCAENTDTKDEDACSIDIPEQCVAINLVPHCALLRPARGLINHDFIQTVPCAMHGR